MSQKIRVKNPVVEMDGDEMARIMWQMIRERLILPFLDLNIEYYDLGIQKRDETEDKITVQAAQAIKEHRVGIKCATITPDEARVKEFNLKKMWRSPNGTIRGIIDGTVFREPIIIDNVPRLIPHWNKPVIIARHAYGDQYAATDLVIQGPGTLKMIFEPAGGAPASHVIHEFKGPGMALGMFNIDSSVEGFARACFKFALLRKVPLFFTTKNTILKKYHGRFKDIFQRLYDEEFK
ncbi:MAG: NADP-dependent isocitrate dehydrogenase, partial [Proteobacteria bacterium]